MLNSIKKCPPFSVQTCPPSTQIYLSLKYFKPSHRKGFRDKYIPSCHAYKGSTFNAERGSTLDADQQVELHKGKGYDPEEDGDPSYAGMLLKA